MRFCKPSQKQEKTFSVYLCIIVKLRSFKTESLCRFGRQKVSTRERKEVSVRPIFIWGVYDKTYIQVVVSVIYPRSILSVVVLSDSLPDCCWSPSQRYPDTEVSRYRGTPTQRYPDFVPWNSVLFQIIFQSSRPLFNILRFYE